MQTQETKQIPSGNLKLNFVEYNEKILPEIIKRHNKAEKELEKLNDFWLELFEKHAVEPEGVAYDGHLIKINERNYEILKQKADILKIVPEELVNNLIKDLP